MTHENEKVLATYISLTKRIIIFDFLTQRRESRYTETPSGARWRSFAG